ncbi:MAG: anti-sigma factor family protein [Georgenia sp.]
MTGGHLGTDVSALVDGQLPPERAEAALVHLVTCDRCAAEVALERSSRRRLSGAEDVPPSTELTDRLLRLAHEPAAHPAQRPWPMSERARRRLVSRTGLVAVGAAGVAGALVVVGTLAERPEDPARLLATALGLQSKSQVVVSPNGIAPATMLTRSDDGAATASTTGSALAWLAGQGWGVPSAVPAGLHVNYVGTSTGPSGETVLEVELVGDGHQILVLQQRGVLDPDALASLETLQLGDVEAYVLPGPGTRLAIQCDEVIVLVASPVEDELVHDVAAAFPAIEPGSGMGDRLDRGWQTLVSWTELIARQP